MPLGTVMLSELWQCDVNRSDMYQFLEVSPKGRHMTSSAPPSYRCLGFRHDGWVQATIFRPWGRNQCSRSLWSCHVSLGLLTSGIHFCDRKRKFSPTEPLSGGSFLTHNLAGMTKVSASNKPSSSMLDFYMSLLRAHGRWCWKDSVWGFRIHVSVVKEKLISDCL